MIAPETKEFYQVLCFLFISGRHQGNIFHQLRNSSDSSDSPCWVTPHNSAKFISQPHLVMSHTSTSSVSCSFVSQIIINRQSCGSECHLSSVNLSPFAGILALDRAINVSFCETVKIDCMVSGVEANQDWLFLRNWAWKKRSFPNQ